MPFTPLSAIRSSLLNPSDLGQIEEAAYRILEQVGIKVQEDLVPTLRQKGMCFHDGRVVFDRRITRTFLEQERAKGGKVSGMDATPPSTQEITLGVSQYSQHVRDAGTGQIRPYTVSTLIEAAKTVDVLADQGVRAGAPGTPMDVPPDLQPVSIYYLSLTYTRYGFQPPDPRSVAACEYVLDMAETVGHPVTLLPVYLVSPLTLAGDSLAAVLAFEKRIASTWVVSMPSAGATAPQATGEAFALAAAEVIGSAMIMHELCDLDVGWEIQIFPFDMRALSIVFGSPENLLMQLASAEVDAYFHGTQWKPSAANIHTMAKTPGPQAAAEKASIMTAGALLGARHFVCAGTLSLDEIFSAEQLLLDCEIAAHVEAVVRGLDTSCDPDACVQGVIEGASRGFLGLDSTLQRYRESCWYPRFFERGLLAAWQDSGSRELNERLREEARHLPSRHAFALPEEMQRELDNIYRRAEKHFSV